MLQSSQGPTAETGEVSTHPAENAELSGPVRVAKLGTAIDDLLTSDCAFPGFRV